MVKPKKGASNKQYLSAPLTVTAGVQKGMYLHNCTHGCSGWQMSRPCSGQRGTKTSPTLSEQDQRLLKSAIIHHFSTVFFSLLLKVLCISVDVFTEVVLLTKAVIICLCKHLVDVMWWLYMLFFMWCSIRVYSQLLDNRLSLCMATILLLMEDLPTTLVVWVGKMFYVKVSLKASCLVYLTHSLRHPLE